MRSMSGKNDSSSKMKGGAHWGRRVLIVVLVGSLGVLWEFRKPVQSKYRATTTVQVDFGPKSPSGIAAVAGLSDPEYENAERLNTLAALISNTDLMRQVIMDHDLMNDTRFGGEAAGSLSLDFLALRLASQTRAERREGTHLIGISVWYPHQDLAVQLVNWICRGFIKQEGDRRLASNQLTKRVLTQEAERLKIKLRNAEVALIELRKSVKLVLSLEKREALLEEELAELSRQLTRPLVKLSRTLKRWLVLAIRQLGISFKGCRVSTNRKRLSSFGIRLPTAMSCWCIAEGIQQP